MRYFFFYADRPFYQPVLYSLHNNKLAKKSFKSFFLKSKKCQEDSVKNESVMSKKNYREGCVGLGLNG